MSSSPAHLRTAAAPRNASESKAGILAHPLHPGLSPQSRIDGTLQLGPDPIHGVVLTGLAQHEAGPASRLLALLAEASDPVRSEALAGATGLPQIRVVEIVHALEEAGLTRRHPAGPDRGDLSAWSLARRRHGGERSVLVGSPLSLKDRREGARVVIDGRGTVAEDVARLLRAARVGAVRCGWYAGAGEDLDDRGPDPSLVITVGTRLPRLRATDWLRRSIAHLPVIARVGSVDIGPLVVPGAGPCLTCIWLHEGTTLLADLGRDDLLADAQNDPTRVEPSLAGITAGTVAMLALGLIDAYPPPLGMRWHSALPLPSLATSRWEVHPECDTHGQSRSVG
ncbi:MAG: hypothetical protein ABR500_11210 [Dermatophilaceae bacterium]|nr:hypothetical protein [Intrasporangiaceae bacterium]